MIVLLWLSLILIPIVTGMGLLSAFYAKMQRYEFSISEGFVLGLIASIGIAEVAHVIGMFGNWNLKKVGGLLGVSLLILIAVSVLALIICFFRQKECLGTIFQTPIEKNMMPFIFIGFLLVQLLYVYCMEPMITAGDILLETVQSFLAEDGIYRVMPLTGEVSETGLPLRYKILCLPTLYTVLSASFHVDAQLLVCNIIPVVVLAGMYFSYYYLSGVLFGTKAIRKRYLFLVLIAVLMFFMDGGVFTNGYSGLHSGYLGTSIRNLILVPYVFAVSLEKCWWKVGLCVLAEACIVWTFWGCGVCLVIGLGMLILTICEAKLPKLRGFMQIFREKEDLT